VCGSRRLLSAGKGFFKNLARRKKEPRRRKTPKPLLALARKALENLAEAKRLENLAEAKR